jgi:small subunit ribosomal protein S8
MQDPVADMLTRIRNAQLMGIKEVTLPFSRLKSDILNVLKDEGYIEEFKSVTAEGKNNLHVTLKYFDGRPVIENIDRVSKPSMRVYRGYDDLPVVRGGLGISVISTPKGVMADKAARAQKVGGEILCTVE